jgi:hypothetical protein
MADARQEAQMAKEGRVSQALLKLLENGRVFGPEFSGTLSLEIEIRNGGLQDVRLSKRIRDR